MHECKNITFQSRMRNPYFTKSSHKRNIEREFQVKWIYYSEDLSNQNVSRLLLFPIYEDIVNK